MAAVLLGATVACAADRDQSSARRSGHVETRLPSTATPKTSAPAGSLGGPDSDLMTSQIFTNDGYHLQATLKTFKISFVSQSIRDQRPGEARLRFKWSGIETLRNVTPGRKAPLEGAVLVPVWSSRSEICNADPANLDEGPVVTTIEKVSYNGNDLEESGPGLCIPTPSLAIDQADLQTDRQFLNSDESLTLTIESAPTDFIVSDQNLANTKRVAMQPIFWASKLGFGQVTSPNIPGACILYNADIEVGSSGQIFASTTRRGQGLCTQLTS